MSYYAILRIVFSHLFIILLNSALNEALQYQLRMRSQAMHVDIYLSRSLHVCLNM